MSFPNGHINQPAYKEIMEKDNSATGLLRLRKRMEFFTPFSDTDFAQWAHLMHEKHFEKGAVLLQEGQVFKQFYFILDGCLRSFSVEEGKDVNVQFYFEDEFACDFESFRNETPSQFNLVAMEDTTVYYAIKTEAVQVLKNESTYLFLFRFFQDHYFKETEHSNSFKLLSPEQRYRYLLEQKPHYIQRVPLIHLATYLGMSRETLTRVRKKIS